MSKEKIDIQQLKFKKSNEEFYPLTTAEAVIFKSDDDRVIEDSQESIHGALMDIYTRLKALEMYYDPITRRVEDIEEKHEIALNPRIVDNLVCESRIRALSARQGVILKDAIDGKLGYAFMSQSQYDSINPHEENKVYFINDDLKIRKFYVGDYVFDPDKSDDPILKLEYNDITVPATVTSIAPIPVIQRALNDIIIDVPEGCEAIITNGTLKITVPANTTVKDKIYTFTLTGKASDEEDDVTAVFNLKQLHEEKISSTLYIQLNKNYKKVDGNFGVDNDILVSNTNCASIEIAAPAGCAAVLNGNAITYSWPVNLTAEKKVYDFIVYGYDEEVSEYTTTKFSVEQDRSGSQDIELELAPDVLKVSNEEGHSHEVAVKVFTGDSLSVTSWPQWIKNVTYHEPSKMFNIEWMANKDQQESRTGQIIVTGVKAGKQPIERPITIIQAGTETDAYMNWESYEYNIGSAAIALNPIIRLYETNTNCVAIGISTEQIEWFVNETVAIRYNSKDKYYYVAGRLTANQSAEPREIELKISGRDAADNIVEKTIKVTQNGI